MKTKFRRNKIEFGGKLEEYMIKQTDDLRSRIDNFYHLKRAKRIYIPFGFDLSPLSMSISSRRGSVFIAKEYIV